MHGIDIPVAAEGLLAEFAQAGVIGWSGVHLARTLGRLVGENRPEVLLAAALCLRAQEAGSVCLPLDDVVQTTAVEPDQDQMPDQIPPPGELPWPGVDEWLAMLASSPLVAVGEQVAENRLPLRLVERRVYLER
ncbi:MAG: exodeoxyribonuclease V subunit alpha, partial [Acidobacteriota bacterium]|nr:exodeoxyribonuclease V subunit alpha [Acidobacteriota bacterium]